MKEATQAEALARRVRGEGGDPTPFPAAVKLIEEALLAAETGVVKELAVEVKRLQDDCDRIGPCAKRKDFPCPACVELSRILGIMEGRK